MIFTRLRLGSKVDNFMNGLGYSKTGGKIDDLLVDVPKYGSFLDKFKAVFKNYWAKSKAADAAAQKL